MGQCMGKCSSERWSETGDRDLAQGPGGKPGSLGWAVGLTSQLPSQDCFLRCRLQLSGLGSPQWSMARMTGRVSRTPGGPQLTMGLSRV